MRSSSRALRSACLLALLSTNAVGQSPAEGAQSPDHYRFASTNVSVVYSPSLSNNGAHLRYWRGNRDSVDFDGDDITVEQTAMGQVVSVTVQQIPDLKSVTLSLVIPDIRLKSDEPVLFDSRVIFTTHHTTIAGPDLVNGPLQTYWSPALIGEASDASSDDSETGVFGKVIQSPTCGGPERPGIACSGPLSDATIVLIDGLDQIVASTTTDDRGRFALSAPSGEYTIELDNGGDTFPICPAKAVEIANRLVTTSMRCDTGVR